MSSITLAARAPATDLTQDRAGFWVCILVSEFLIVAAFAGILGVTLILGAELKIADLAMGLCVIAMIVGVPSSFASWQRTRCLRDCEISLDRDWLTYKTGKSVFRWRWRDLEPFEAVRPGGWLPRIFVYPHIGITLREESTPLRLLRMWREPRVIVDAYDTSLEDIAAQLNEYHARALGS